MRFVSCRNWEFINDLWRTGINQQVRGQFYWQLFFCTAFSTTITVIYNKSVVHV